jgi:hypothetical protein
MNEASKLIIRKQREDAFHLLDEKASTPLKDTDVASTWLPFSADLYEKAAHLSALMGNRPRYLSYQKMSGDCFSKAGRVFDAMLHFYEAGEYHSVVHTLATSPRDDSLVLAGDLYAAATLVSQLAQSTLDQNQRTFLQAMAHLKQMKQGLDSREVELSKPPLGDRLLGKRDMRREAEIRGCHDLSIWISTMSKTASRINSDHTRLPEIRESLGGLNKRFMPYRGQHVPLSEGDFSSAGDKQAEAQSPR